MNRPVSAMAGGLVGVTIMSVVLAMIEVEARYVIGIFDAIARFARVPGEPAVGFVLYALVGIVVWPLLFLSLKPYVPLELDPAEAGMLFGAGLWVPFAVIGRGDMAGGLLLLYLSFTLVAHLAYGFSLGAVYAHLADVRPE